MPLSTASKNRLLDLYLGGDHDAAFPATVYVALLTDSGTVEVTGGSYARVAVTNNDTNWPDASGGIKSNGTAITFPTATAAWGDVDSFALMTASSGGSAIATGTLVTTISPVSSSTPSFGAGLLVVRF